MHSFHISKRQFSLALMCSLGAPRLWSSSSAAATAGSNITDIISSKQPMADYTEVFEAAILKQHRNRLGDLYVPAGVWPLRTLTLRDFVRLRGAGRNATILKALPSDAPGFITLATGPVRSSGLSNLSLDGGSPDKATNPNQWAISLISRAEQQAEIPNGGLWSSEFDGITIYNFSRGIELVGDRTRKYMLPHQFLSFRNIVSQLSKDLVGPILRVAGQVDQVMFQQCLFDHWKRSLTKDFELQSSALCVELGEVGGENMPLAIHFDVCTFQSCRQAVEIAMAQNVLFTSCWFEELAKGIIVAKDGVGISILDCRFANAAAQGAAVQFSAGASGRIQGNVFAGKRTRQSIIVESGADVSVDANRLEWGAGE